MADLDARRELRRQRRAIAAGRPVPGWKSWRRHQLEARELGAGSCVCSRCLDYVERRRANGEPSPRLG